MQPYLVCSNPCLRFASRGDKEYDIRFSTWLPDGPTKGICIRRCGPALGGTCVINKLTKAECYSWEQSPSREFPLLYPGKSVWYNARISRKMEPATGVKILITHLVLQKRFCKFALSLHLSQSDEWLNVYGLFETLSAEGYSGHIAL